MRKMVSWMAAALLLVPVAVMAADPVPAPGTVQVMVLGTYHMANPNRDLHNVAAEDVRTPRRQAELARLSHALAAFRPTKVMVEADGEGADLAVPAFRSFDPADLLKSRNERVQIGYRLARDAGLAEVQGIDVEGDFPFDAVQAWADRNGRRAELDAIGATVERAIDRFNAMQAGHSVGQLLGFWNQPTGPVTSNDFYYRLLGFGDAKEQPGALLNAAWYRRNALIFARLASVAKPGDRIVVIYGAGHGYWLRHFARETPGFALVDPLPYLKRAG